MDLDLLLKLSAVVTAVLAVLAVPGFLWRQRHQLQRALCYIGRWFCCRLRDDCLMMPVRGMTSPILFGPDGTSGGDTIYQCPICRRTEMIPWNR